MPVRQLESDDPRVRRSERAVGSALLALIHERGFESITVQNILDRAGVARATFYAHYRNKDDVLYSGYEQLFAYLEAVLERPSSRRRLMPVAEFLSHLNRAGVFLDWLRAGKKLDEMLDLGTAFTARIIEVRLAPTTGIRPGVPRALLARMLAAAFMEMAKWWLDHRASSSPEEMDVAFHAFAEATLHDASYVAPRARA